MKYVLMMLLSNITIHLYSQAAFTTQVYDYNHLIDRYEILSGSLSEKVFSGFKPYRRDHILDFITSHVQDSLMADTSGLSKRDLFNFSYINDDNWDLQYGKGNSTKPLFNFLYQKKNALVAVDDSGFRLIANPVLSFWAGKESGSDKSYNYHNSRGVELRGSIDNRVGFYTYFTDNQSLLPMYVRQSISPVDTLKRVLMGENYIKNINNGTIDYISARGYVTFKVTKHIGLQFGHDKNFIGNGYRSLVLSENSGAYNFLKFKTKVWKFQYTNLFCQLTAIPTIHDSPYPKKYLALHHLSVNIGKHLNIGLFESVTYGNRGGFDLNYLNPIIFYRSVEQNLGSADNAFLGGDWKLNFLRHFSWYGQVLIDEFLIKNVRAQNGSWTNKQAIQTGVKYCNVLGVDNLDLQGELNIVRPYTYAHIDHFRNYSHYLQPLAHPRGANFREFVGIARYQPINKLQLLGKLIYVKQGLDSIGSGSSVGSNVLLSYSDRMRHNGQMDTGHKIGQGMVTSLLYMELTASYMLKHNLFLDLSMVYRNQSASEARYSYKHNVVTLGLRANVARKSYDW